MRGGRFADWLERSRIILGEQSLCVVQGDAEQLGHLVGGLSLFLEFILAHGN